MYITGEKISPIEVDAVLLAHPNVAQGVSFGVPDPKYGEEVTSLPIECDTIFSFFFFFCF